jgi:hypothetical protein
MIVGNPVQKEIDMAQQQNYENHARYVPAYHFVLFGILVLNLVWSVYRLIRYWMLTPGQDGMRFLIAVAMLIFFVYIRQFAMTLQDRIIRLEMTLRLEKLLPAGQQGQIREFTVGQLIAMRFASDAELPALAARVLSEKITDRKKIKQLIKNWVADNLRA